MRFAICNETFQDWEWPRLCDCVAKTGYDAVEIAPFTLAEDATRLPASRRRELRRVAEAAGLAISGLHWLLVSPPGLSLNGPDDGRRRRTAGFLVDLAGLAADLGANRMVLGSPKQRWVGDDDTPAAAWERARETVESLVPALEDTAVVLCLEPLPPPEANFLLTIDEAIRLAEEMDHPNVKVIADVKSLCSEGDPATIIRRVGPGWIEYVHANDANRRGPGFGDVDFAPIASALRDVGYDGTVSVEVFDYSPDPETIARESLRTLRAAFGAA